MDCVSKILNVYDNTVESSKIDNASIKQLWLSKLLIKVMDNFAKNRIDKFELRNCLLLLINLFSDSTGPDRYCKSGINARDLSLEEKIQFKEILLGEFSKE